jgi:hypothetical protein
LSIKPAILSSYDPGRHNVDLNREISYLEETAQHKDLSLVILIPAHKYFPPRVVASWLNIINPPNNKFARIFAIGMEVGNAYSKAIEAIAEHPEMGTWKYLLTLEHDNIPPPNGVMALLGRMESEEGKQYAAIGGLYFTKGEGGVAQIWGDPRDNQINFRPQKPSVDGELVECCGTGMGFTLFRMSMFKDGKISKPWFKTPGMTGEGLNTQDLYFWHKAREEGGYRCAIDCSVKVGHYDDANDVVW